MPLLDRIVLFGEAVRQSFNRMGLKQTSTEAKKSDFGLKLTDASSQINANSNSDVKDAACQALKSLISRVPPVKDATWLTEPNSSD